MTRTAINSSGRKAVLAATLLVGFVLPLLTSNAEEQLPDPGATIDPVAVGSVAAGSPQVVTGRPLTTTDIDPSLCAEGQLVLNFVSGDLICEWAVPE